MLTSMLMCCGVAACGLQVNFEQDAVISQMNEYEVLQLLMGDCRESLAAYKTSLEEDTKLLQVRMRAICCCVCGFSLLQCLCLV